MSSRSGKAITFISIKGGVGKTTIMVNVANELAERESEKVLIIDLDAQAGSSLYVLGPERLRSYEEQERTLYHLIQRELQGEDIEKIEVMKYIAKAEGKWSAQLYVLPGSAQILEIEREFSGKSGAWLFKLRRIVKRLEAEGYRYVFIDPPASFTVLSRSAFAACDYFLVPVVPDEFGLNALAFFESGAFSATVRDLIDTAMTFGATIEIPLCGGVFANKVRRGTYLADKWNEIASKARNIKLYGKWPIPVYTTILYDYIDYARALEQHKPVKYVIQRDKEGKKKLEEFNKFFNEFREYVIKDKARTLADFGD